MSPPSLHSIAALSCHHYDVRALLTPLKGVQVAQGGAGNVLERFLGQESLVTGEEDIRVRKQAGQECVTAVALANLAEEVVLLVLVHVEADRADVRALEGVAQGRGIDEPATRGVDDDDAGLRG